MQLMVLIINKKHYKNIKLSKNLVEASIKRLGLEKQFKSLHAKIYPQVKSLDKIVKRASKIINDPSINPTEKFKFLAKEYAKGDTSSGRIKHFREFCIDNSTKKQLPCYF